MLLKSQFGGILCGLLACAHIQHIVASKRFHLGRDSVHGFLGEPSKFVDNIDTTDIPDQWIEQPLDHFLNSLNKTWKQRYWANGEHYRADELGPIFLMIGGEAEASKRWMKSGAWMRYAQHFGAYCFQVEHRFYGKSRPTEDLSLKSLQYLSSEQALADLEHFIREMNKKYNFSDKQKWIVFGGSYSGSLAAWLREKYPELVHGAISSSAPLLAKVDFKEYFEVVTASLGTYSPDCVTAVRRSFEQLEVLMRHMVGQHNIDVKFKTCTPIKDSIENTDDIANLYENIAGYFADVVQYNKGNSPHAKVSIDEVCEIMLNQTIGAPVTRLAAINNLMLNISDEKCLDYKYDTMIKKLQQSSWLENNDSVRQWTYQTCNEFGFYQTAEDDDQTFGSHFNINFFIRQCSDIFSDKMNMNYVRSVVQNTNRIYGGLHPNATNIFYIHGSIDPWHVLGMLKNGDSNVKAILVKGTSHCADMYEPLSNEIPELVDVRNKILKFLANLLNNFKL